MCQNYVAYRRVSTAGQHRSGLGLEAQEAAVEAFIAGKGVDARLLASFTEVESGRRSDNRPELARAMEHARLTGSTLLIAKLDRLSRDAHFLLGLQKEGVAFTACDMPYADQFTVGVLALVAQKEREAISTRTKEALAGARKRVAVTGQRKHPEIKRLGCPTGAEHLRGKGFEERARQALMAATRERAVGLASTFAALKAEGVMSATGLAKALNERGYATPRGGQWTARSVINVQGRLR